MVGFDLGAAGMTGTTEPHETRPRRPRTIAAPLLAVLTALPGAWLAGGLAVASSRNEQLGIGAYILGGILTASAGYVVGWRIDRRGYPRYGGWRAVLIILGSLLAIALSMTAVRRILHQSLAAGVLVLTLAPIIGALCGARIGEAFDRRREITGESAEGDEESSR